ncbi:hypothetical protein [Streptomyces sp. Tu 4128]|uniref:hypothetical protein n=1 Tax=Streptomyces sp. Tu 4128 TaxID=1120314 RepID=UPI000F01598E|nr:hypothetical protein [Streptomyces sp. Tu 4128]
MRGGAQYGFIISLDTQSSGSTPDPDRPVLRERIYRVAEDAFLKAGIGSARLAQEDRGDGILAVVEPRRPEALVGEWTEYLHQNLRQVNRELSRPLRLRAGLGVGPFTPDDDGFSGAAVDLACRIGNCEEAKAVLAGVSDAPLLVAVTDQLHHDVVRHGGRWIEPAHYRRFRLRLKEGEQQAWFTVPGRGGPPPEPGAGETAQPAGRDARAARDAGSGFHFGNVTVSDSAQAFQGSFGDITIEHRRGGSGSGEKP